MGSRYPKRRPWVLASLLASCAIAISTISPWHEAAHAATTVNVSVDAMTPLGAVPDHYLGLNGVSNQEDY